MAGNNDQQELLPCPFCGSTNVYDSSNGLDSHYFNCCDCGAEGPACKTVTGAGTAWNQRTPSSADDKTQSDAELMRLCNEIVNNENDPQWDYDSDHQKLARALRTHLSTQQGVNGRLVEALQELAELVDLAARGEYKIDSFTTQPAHSALRSLDHSGGCAPTDITVLRKANIDLANESRRYQSALEEVHKLFSMWEGGLDEMDGEEYRRACNEWDRVERLVEESLEVSP